MSKSQRLRELQEHNNSLIAQLDECQKQLFAYRLRDKPRARDFIKAKKEAK